MMNIVSGIFAISLSFLFLPCANAQSNKSSKTKTTAAAPLCRVSDFRTLVQSTHDPQNREHKAVDWLKTNGSACSIEKLFVIKNNRALWLGTADSALLMGMVDGAIEAKTGDNPELLAQLYNPTLKMGAASAESQPKMTDPTSPDAAGGTAAKPTKP